MKLDAPAFHRNKQPMLDVLHQTLPANPLDIIEIAAGSGQHGPFFTDKMSNLTWWPTDIDPQAITSINAWRTHLGASAIQPATILDVTNHAWQNGEAIKGLPDSADVILSMNMIHIAPHIATLGLLSGAGRRLNQAGLLILYGPFKQQNVAFASSNQTFDDSLKSRNPQWGIRQLEDVSAVAKQNSLHLKQVIEMPANNLAVILEKVT